MLHIRLVRTFTLVLKRMANFTIRIVGSQFEQILINLLSKTIYKNDLIPLIKQVNMKRNYKKLLKSKNYLQNNIKPLVKYPLCNKKQAEKLLY